MNLARCYLIKPYRKDASKLIEALKRRKIEFVSPAGPSPGGEVLRGALAALESADFVVAVAGQSDVNVFYELGMAFALGKPALLFLEPGARLPPDLAGLQHTRGSLRNTEAIEIHVDAFLAHLGRRQREPERLPPKFVRPEWGSSQAQRAAQELLELAQKGKSSDGQGAGVRAESLVQTIFEGIGARTSRPVVYHDAGIDLFVWVDELEPWFGNPIAVEIKVHAQGPARLRHALRMTEDALRRGQGRFALLLYGGPDLKEPSPPQSGRVLPVRLEDFSRWAASGTLLEELRLVRNRIVHGSG